MIKNWSLNLLEAGCDEAGRGCLAGPVVAAAVILPPNFKLNSINDSKKLSKSQREEMAAYIRKDAISFGIGVIDAAEIDRINILQASIQAMHQAIAKLLPQPDLLLTDGNQFRTYKNISHQCIIGGDGLVASIAAASILAKVHRDHLMCELHQEHPQYGWDINKGYATKVHRKALQDYGPTPFHRRTFLKSE